MVRCLIIIIILCSAIGGQIQNQAKRGISGFRNNRNSDTDLVFTPLILTTTTLETYLIVSFPQDYQYFALSANSYGSIVCPVELTSTKESICPQYETDKNNLSIYLPQGILAGQYQLRVKQNVNPSVMTAINVFSIKTLSQGIIIDQNQFFGEFKLADPVNKIEKITIVNGSSTAGNITQITLEFSIQTEIKRQIRIRIPQQFQSFPGKSLNLLIGLDSQSPQLIPYSYFQRWIHTNLTTLYAGTYRATLEMSLPTFETTTDPFQLELLINNTNTVVEYYEFSGVSTSPGLLSPTFTYDNLNTNRVANYSVSFYLQNPIINGQITLQLSDSYTLSTNCITNYLKFQAICEKNNKTYKISNVTLYSGQYFLIQFLVLNPSDSSIPYSIFLNTFTKFNNTLKTVDSSTINIQLSSIQTPIFQSFEMYRPVVNASLNDITAIDFRLIPNKGNELTLTSGSDKSYIMFQLPLWWRVEVQSWNDLYNNFYPYYSNCTFGSQGSQSCSYSLQVFTMTTPIQQLDDKYPANSGLGQCDKPIAMQKVRMPPIPGRFDFRVLTFNNKSTSSAPTQQSMFTMDIPVQPFTSLTVEMSSLQATDMNSILYVKLVVGIQVPDQGSININVSTVETSTLSAWHRQFGRSFTAPFTRTPCAVYIDGSYQTTQQCYIYDMDTYAVIQVSNLGTLTTNKNVQIFLNNIKFCQNITKVCQVQVSTAYTVSISNPYYLNKQTVQLTNSVQAATPITAVTQSTNPEMSFSLSGSASLCRTSDWTLSVSPSILPQIGDYIIVTIPAEMIYLSVTSIYSNNGPVAIIMNNTILNIVIRYTNNTGNLQIVLRNMRHPNEEGTSIAPEMVYWSSKRKPVRCTFPPVTFLGSSIYDTSLDILPDSSNNLQKSFTDTDLGSEAILRLTFRLCKPVKGWLIVDFQDGLDWNNTCVVIGLKGTPKDLGSTITCQLSSGIYNITGFLPTSPMTSVTTIFRVNVNTTIDLNELKLYSYNDSSTIVGDNLNGLNSAVYAFGRTGYTYPPLLQLDPFVVKPKQAVMNQRGQFYFDARPIFTHSYPEEITFNFGAIIQTTTDGRLHCRINGVLADLCRLSSYVVRLKLPIGFTMNANENYTIFISTRGRDNSLTEYEGLTLQSSGIYTLLVEAGSNSTGNYEFTYIAVEVLPQEFWNYWVYSISKNIKKTTIQDGLTIYQINFGCSIPNNSKLIVSLFRTNLQTDGFEKDLGTGIENGGSFPCFLTFGDTNTLCTLYHGVWPNPTQIEISNFGALSGSFTIRLPNMFNPNVSLSIVKVGLLATVTSSTGLTTKLYSSSYDLVNVTFGLPSPLITQTVYQNLTTSPTFDCNSVSTYCLMTLPFKSGSLSNQNQDNIVIQFPQDYPIDDGYVYSSWPFCVNCSLCHSRSKIVAMRTYWGLAANSATSGWLNISTPLYRSLSGMNSIPLKIYIYRDFKLLKVMWTNMTQSFTETTFSPVVSADDTNVNAYTTYRINITMTVAIRAGAVMLIKIPPELSSPSAICHLQTSTGSLIANNDFNCLSWNTSQLLAQNFGALAKNQSIVVIVKILNPATIVSVSNWTLQVFYKKQVILDKLIAKGTAKSPVLTNTITTNTYWDQEFQQQTDIKINERGTIVIILKEDVGSGIKTITFPSGAIILPQNRQLFCLVTTNEYNEQVYETSANTVPLQCTLSNNIITIPQITPYLQTTNAVTKVIITTLNDNGGLLFPIGGEHILHVETYADNVNDIPVYVDMSSFTLFTSKTFITNPKTKTLVSVQFTPSKNANKVALLFPLVDRANDTKPIYSPDLGTGLMNNSQVSCWGRQGYTVDTLIPCTIIMGQVGVQSYTSILINQPISSGTSYKFQIDSIMTPAIINNDYTHVTHVLQSYDASGNVLDRSSYYDYTVRNIAYLGEPISYKPFLSTTLLNDTGVTYKLQAKNFILSTNNDYLVIEFPQQYYKQLPQKTIKFNNLTNIWVSSGNNWVLRQPTVGLAANSTINFELQDCFNSHILSPSIVITIYYVTDRVIVQKYSLNPMDQLGVPTGSIYVPPATPTSTTSCNFVSVSTSSSNAGIGIQLLETRLTTSSPISISFTLVMQFSSPEFALSDVYTSPPSQTKTVGGAITMVFSELQSQLIIVSMFGRQISQTVNLKYTLYNDVNTTLDVYSHSFTGDSTTTLNARATLLSPRLKAMKDEPAELKLTMKLTQPMLRRQYLLIDVSSWAYFTPSSTTIWNTFINELAAQKTVYASNTISIYSPIMGIGNNTIITIRITSVSMKMLTGTTTKDIIHKDSTGANKETYSKKVVSLQPNFVTSSSLYFVSTTEEQYSILKTNINLNNPLTTSDSIILNLHTKQNNSILFQPDLGGYRHLQLTDCISQHILTCRIFKGAPYEQAPTSIVMTPIIISTNTLKLSIPKLLIPKSSNTTFLVLSMILIKNGSNVSQLVKQYVMYPQSRTTFQSAPDIINPTPNLIGAPSTYAIQLKSSVIGSSYDRIVMQYSDNLILQHPFNYNNPSLTTTMTNGNIIMYPITKWLQLAPTSSISQGNTLTLNNLKNVGWAQSLTVKIIEMTSSKYVYYNCSSDIPTPNAPVTSYQATPSPVLISQSETFTIVIYPMNRIYSGGWIKISLPNMGLSGSQLCSVISGLQAAKCDVDWNNLQITLSGFKQYEPILVDTYNYANNIRNPIKIEMQLTMPSTAQTALTFSISIYNNTLSVNEQKSAINSGITVNTGNIFPITLRSVNLSPQIINGNSYGTISLSFQISTTLSFTTSDYVAIDFGDAITSRYLNLTDNLYYPFYSEIMCHLAVVGTLIQKVKTHRCQFYNWTVLRVFVPEEFNVESGKKYKITIENMKLNTSDIYWLKFFYVKNGVWGTERGWKRWNIPSTKFIQRDVTLLTEEMSDSRNNLTMNIMNLTMTTSVSLPASTDPYPSRIVLAFPTHNQQNKSFPMVLRDGPTIPCHGVYHGTTIPMSVFTSLTCYNIESTNDIWNNTPSYITINSYNTISANIAFNIQLGRFGNPLTKDTFADIKITIEKLTKIGQWVPLVQNIMFNLIYAVAAAPTPANTVQSYNGIGKHYVRDSWGRYFTNVVAGYPLEPNDVIVLTFSQPYQVPNRVSCTQTSKGVTSFQGCSTIPSENMFILPNNYYLTASDLWSTEDYYSFSSPKYTSNSSSNASILTLQIYASKKLKTRLFKNISASTKSSFVVMQPTTDDNQENTQQLYHIGVSVVSVNPAISYLQLKAPLNFTDIYSCQVNKGLRRYSAENPISCIWEKQSSYWLIKLGNFMTYSSDGLMILDMVLGNPSSGWTTTWSVTSYLEPNNYQNRITETANSRGQIWVGKAPMRPLHFHVYRNKESFEDRKATINQFAELWARVIPRSAHSNQTRYVISMPITYDLPNGQKTDCNVSYDIKNRYQPAECVINFNRSVTVSAPTTGISQQCQIISATSTNAIDNRNGFLLPPNITAGQKFGIGMYDPPNAEQTLETQGPRPLPLEYVFADATVREQSYSNSIIRMKFKTNTPIPAGYYPDLPIGYQGRIEILFETKWVRPDFYVINSFSKNITFNNKCLVISGLRGSVTCQMETALRQSPYDYAKITISNFDEILNNTMIEIHLLDALYARDYGNGRANIGVCTYEIDETGKRVDLSQPTFYSNPLTITYNNNNLSQYYIPQYNQNITMTFSPHYVGSISIVTFSYVLSRSLSSGDMIEVRFPKEFNLTGDVVAADAEVMLYKDINTILLTVVDSMSNVQMKMVVDASYVYDYPVSANISVIQSNSVIHKISAVVDPPAAAPFSLNILRLSDYVAERVAVNYTFSFMPSYRVENMSKIVIDFPSNILVNYSHLSFSNPKEFCLTDLGSCTISPNKVLISQSVIELQPGTTYQITVVGVKNPKFSGILPNTSFTITIYRVIGSKSYVHSSGSVQSFRMYPLTNNNQLYLRISASSYFKNVTADYALAIQTSSFTPKQTMLILLLPKDWAPTPQILAIIGNWGINNLFYSEERTENTTHTNITITIKFQIPAKSIITIKFKPIVNTNVTTTSQFSAETIYDSTTIDKFKDSLAVTLVDTPPNLPLSSFSYTPTTEFEPTHYQMEFQAELPEDSLIVIYFPTSFINNLIGALPLTAYINQQYTETTIESRKLTLYTLRNLTKINISLFGLLNPPVGVHKIDLALIKTVGNVSTVTQYSNQQIEIITTKRPQTMLLSNFTLSNNICSTFSNLQFCMSNLLKTKIIVRFPQEFADCSVSDAKSKNASLTYQVTKQLKMIMIDIPQTPQICITLVNLKNTEQPGWSHPFIVSEFDQNMVTATNFPNLNTWNILPFVKQKLSITLSTIADFSMETCSLPVTMTLERSSATPLTITGNIDKFNMMPSPLSFNESQLTAQFIICPKVDAPYGISSIQWQKIEQPPISYVEIMPTLFKVIKKQPTKYVIMLSTVLSTTPIYKTSTNITLTLPISPSKPLSISIEYLKSPECLVFSTDTLVFNPGELQKSFNFTSKSCAVSDFIRLSISQQYLSTYTLYSQYITVQLTQPDTQPPTVINHYVFDLARNYIVYRIMTNEPVKIYCMLTWRGTSKPTVQQLRNDTLRSQNGRRTAVMEKYVENKSVLVLHANYTSYDSYLYLQDLDPNHYYRLYFMAVDLSDNPSDVLEASIRTDPEYYSAVITLCLDNTTDHVINTVVESTRWEKQHLQIISDSLIMRPYAYSPRPIEAAQLMDSDLLYIRKQIPLCQPYTFTENTYENVTFTNGWVTYGLSWVNDAQIGVWAQVQQDGMVYASVGGHFPEQIENCLTADNFKLYPTWCRQTYAFAGQKVEFNLSQLYDQTEYKVYLTSKNTQGKSMQDDDVGIVIGTTKVTTYSLPAQYIFSMRMLLPLFVLLALL